MAAMIDLSDDDGFVNVKMGGTEKAVDLYQVHNRLIDIYNTHKNDNGNGQSADDAILASQRTFMQGLGLNPGSDRQVVRFADAIFKAVAEKKSKDSPVVLAETKPDSPVSTEPTL